MAKDSLKKLFTIDIVPFLKSLKTASKSIEGLSSVTEAFGTTLSKAFKATEIVGFALGIKKLTNMMIDATKKQTSYIENLNLLNVAYGDVNNSGKKLISTISNLTGFEQSGLTKSLGTYRQIASALGLANDTAEKLSENLLKMQLDISSLYNLEIDVAGNKLISAITGQSRAVKVLGADITDAGLQVTAYNLGIERSVQSMSQAEKTVLRYVTLQNQLSNSQGDLSRTINSVANQTKIWKDQIILLGRQIGGFLIPILEGILPILNGILMAANEVLSFLLGILGIDASSLADGFGVATASVDLFNDSLNSTEKAANSAIKALRGFDKLNVIRTPDSTGGLRGGLGISADMLKGINEYSAKLDEINNKAYKIKKAILEWLGFAEKANGEWEFTGITFGTIVGTTGAIVAGLKLYTDVADTFAKIGKLLTFSTEGASGAANGGIVGIISGFGNLIAGAFGAETLGTLGSFMTGLGGIAAVALALWGTIELIQNTRWDEAFSWWNEGSDETNVRIGNVHTKVQELQALIDRFSYTGLIMNSDDYNAIIGKITELKTSALTELDSWYTSELQKLDELYPTEEAKQTESYKNRKTELENYYKENQDKLDEYVKEYSTKFEEFYKNDKKISAEERLELLEIQKKFDIWSIESLTSGLAERNRLQAKYDEESKKAKLKHDLELLQEAKETEKKKTEAAKKAHDERIKYAEDAYGKDTEQYKKAVEDSKKIRDKEIQDAKDDYQKHYDNFAAQWEDILNYVDVSTGTLKEGILQSFGGLDGAIDVIVRSLEGTASSYIENILAQFTKVEREYNKFTKKIKDNPIEYDIKASGNPNSGYSFKASPKAEGGWLTSGELYVTRENGIPEMVGSIGNRGAVANNDQIVEAISIGVAKAMIATNQSNKVVIEAEGDTSGLLSFINFKQKEQERQYGL